MSQPARFTTAIEFLSTTQDEDKVTLRCSDDETYVGSILAGADGAYSSVRQIRYKELAKDGRLPKSDNRSLDMGMIVLWV